MLLVAMLLVPLEELVDHLSWYDLGCSHQQKSLDVVVTEKGYSSLWGSSGLTTSWLQLGRCGLFNLQENLPDINLAVLIVRGARGLVLLRMPVLLYGRVLVFTLSITSWLQSRTLKQLAQILCPTGIIFLASTADL